jgi:hypothetical protein
MKSTAVLITDQAARDEFYANQKASLGLMLMESWAKIAIRMNKKGANHG